MKMKKQVNISLAMKAEWKNTARIQEGVWNCLSCFFEDRDYADLISMVSTELVENAVKYGAGDENDESAIDFYLRGNEEEIIIEVKNKVTDEQAGSIRLLDETIQWLRGFQNPWEAYVERLQEVSRSASVNDSRMGMVRMAYEAGAVLDFFVDENNVISVSAVIPLG